MSDGEPRFALPMKIEKLLTFLALRYEKTGDDLIYRLLVNSSYEVFEGAHYQEWSSGGHSFGHDLLFYVPPPIYNDIFNIKDKLASKLKSDLNHISSTQDEHIEEVLFEITDVGLPKNWRENSDAMLVDTSVPDNMSEQLVGIWNQGYLRLFLSHKVEYKREASQLKDILIVYGVTCFVAHQDIEPTKEWQNQIEIALFSMDVLAALLTEDFPDSKWTDQEVGVAIGRRIPIVPVHLGIDPYGFIGKYQALPGRSKNIKVLALELYDLLWSIPKIHKRLINGLVTSFEDSESFPQSQSLMVYLEKIESAQPDVIDRLERAFEVNPQVGEAYRVQNRLPGLIKRLRGID